VAFFGGNANNGTNAGAFNWNLNNDSGNANQNIGTQLYFLNALNILASWQNIWTSVKVLVGQPKVLDKLRRSK